MLRNSSSGNIKYHGLFNQGATCYLNSVLQVLFMTKEFREAVGRCACDNSDNLDFHLKTLFAELQRGTTNTYDITKKLGINTVYEQRDAAEYLEKILTLTGPEASKIFHVQLTHTTVCSQCKTEKSTNAPMWHLPLSLTDSHSQEYSVIDGIEEYFRDIHFSGLDQMYCDQCDAKVDATIKCEVKHHSEVLILLLKRFGFDYDYMGYVKNNRFVDLPRTLQIPKNETYELYAVVNHFGDLRGGHYTATIKSQDDNNELWYDFNDISVTLSRYQQPTKSNSTEKSCSAYLLFYRKTTDICTENIRNVSMSGGSLPATSDNEQSQDAEEIVNEVGGTAESVSVDRHEETGIREVEPSSDLCHNVNDQSSGANVRHRESHAPQECNEGINDLYDYHPHTHEEQTDQGEIIGDTEDMEGHKETGDQKLEGETLPQTHLEGKAENQHNASTELDGDGQRRMDNVLEIHDPLDKPDELNDTQRKLMDPKTVTNGQTGGDELSEKPLTENFNRNPEHQVSERLEDARKSTNNGDDNQDQKLEISDTLRELDLEQCGEENGEGGKRGRKPEKTQSDAQSTSSCVTKHKRKSIFEENDTSILNLNEMSDVQEQDAGTKHPSDTGGNKKRKWWQIKHGPQLSKKRKNSKEKMRKTEKQKKFAGCFPLKRRQKKLKRE